MVHAGRLRALLVLWVAIALLFSPKGYCADPPPSNDPEPAAITEDLFFEEIPVVFAASKRIQSPREAPASVTVITEEDIERFGYRTVGDALRSVPGLYVSYDRNYEKVGVRGIGLPGDYNTRILILVDGHSANEHWSGSSVVDRSIGIPTQLVRRIEVIRGPASTMYGTSAFLAVVNIVTRQENLLNETELYGELGSFESRAATVVSGYTLDNGLQWLGSASAFQMQGDDHTFFFPDDPSRDGIRVERVDHETAYQAFLSAKYKEFSIFGQYSTRKKGWPTAPYDADYGDEDNYTVDRRAFVELAQTASPWEPLSVEGRLFFDLYKFMDLLEYREDGPWKDLGEDLWWGGELRSQVRLSRENHLTVGLEYLDHRVEDASFRIREGPNEKKYRFRVYAFYVEDLWNFFEKLQGVGGVRYDKNTLYDAQVSPRGGLLFFPWKDTTLKLLYSEAFRSPSIYERFFDDETYFAANPSLKPERIRSITCVLEQELLAGLTGSLTYYHNWLDDLILQVFNDEIERFQYQNVLDLESDGVQLALEGQTAWGLRGFANFSFQDSRVRSGGDEVANSPKFLANAGLSIPFWKRKLFGSVLLHFVDSRYTADPSEEVSDYLRADLTLYGDRIWRGLSASLSVYNLYDIRYEDPVAEETSLTRMLQDGRTFWLRLSYCF